MLTGFEAYALYHSLKLHFSGSYDYFKYNGKSSVKVESYEKNKGRYHFQKLSRKFTNKDDLLNFYVANFLVNPSVWVLDLLEEEANANYSSYVGYFQSLSYNFRNDLETLFKDTKNPMEVLETSGDYPKAYFMMTQGSIRFQTLCILNSILEFLPMWDKKIDDEFRYPNYSKLIKKYSGFIPESDISKCKTILKDFMNERKQNGLY